MATADHCRRLEFLVADLQRQIVVVIVGLVRSIPFGFEKGGDHRSFVSIAALEGGVVVGKAVVQSLRFVAETAWDVDHDVKLLLKADDVGCLTRSTGSFPKN